MCADGSRCPRKTNAPADYAAPYHEAVKMHGAGFEATLWSSPKTQNLRFKIITDMAPLANKRILDAGAGQGDFAHYLIEHQIGFAHYVGLDCVPELVCAAKENAPAQCAFYEEDFIKDEKVFGRFEPDWVIFSGSLNTLDETQARKTIQQALDAAREGVVFNFLSNRFHEKWKEHELPPARRFDTLAFLDWSLERSSRVSFQQDYLDGHDATILIYNEC